MKSAQLEKGRKIEIYKLTKECCQYERILTRERDGGAKRSSGDSITEKCNSRQRTKGLRVAYEGARVVERTNPAVQSHLGDQQEWVPSQHGPKILVIGGY